VYLQQNVHFASLAELSLELSAVNNAYALQVQSADVWNNVHGDSEAFRAYFSPDS
jgi:hypothetical protein